DNHAKIGDVPGVDVTVESAIDAFRIALEHEEKVSSAIRDLWNLAADERDVDSRPLLDWFVNEQIEEEDTVRGIIGRLELIDGDGNGILRIDGELSARNAQVTE